MDNILEALKKALPADQVAECAAAVQEMLNKAKADLEAEMNKNLAEAYEKLAEEKATAEAVAVEGYEQAWSMISDLRNRNELLKTEYINELNKSFEEAFQEIKTEQGKVEKIEKDLYDWYKNKYDEATAKMVDNLDTFLKGEGKAIYEAARREVINDPAVAEHKFVLDKVVETVSSYIADEDKVLATGSKLTEANKNLAELQRKVSLLEAKNIRISNDNLKLNEQVRDQTNLLSEANKNKKSVEKTVELRERVEKAETVSGRAKITNQKVVEVIAENNEETTVAETNEVSSDIMANLQEWQALAGIKQTS